MLTSVLHYDATWRKPLCLETWGLESLTACRVHLGTPVSPCDASASSTTAAAPGSSAIFLIAMPPGGENTRKHGTLR